MITILVDYNIQGQALMLWRTLQAGGWPELCSLQLAVFDQVGLDPESSDQEVWRFAQKNEMILLTANRNMKRKDSLEQTIRKENSPTALPVLTIGNVKRMIEKAYRERCAEQLVEIVLDLENCLGRGRIFIP